MRQVTFVDQPDQAFLGTTQGGISRPSSITCWTGSPPERSRIAGQHSVSATSAKTTSTRSDVWMRCNRQHGMERELTTGSVLVITIEAVTMLQGAIQSFPVLQGAIRTVTLLHGMIQRFPVLLGAILPARTEVDGRRR